MGHPRFLNVLRRVAALWFISLGTLAGLASFGWIVWPGLFPDEAPIPIWGKFASGFLCALVVAFGVHWVRVPTYRHDLGDTMRLMDTKPWPEELARRQGRSWWTGDPRPENAQRRSSP